MIRLVYALRVAAISAGSAWLVIRLIPSVGLAQSPPPFAIVQPWQTVGMEHEDREARLRRLADLRGIAAPEFYEYKIPPSRHRLAQYPVELPVLRVVFSDRVFFDFNKDQLRKEAAAVLKTVSQSLRLEPPDVTVFVAGHTDAVGSANYNLNLGLRRAQTVAVALARLGVNQAQIYVVSFGKAVPISSNDSDAGRSRNRRVEFLFAARPEPIAAWLSVQPAPTCSSDRSGEGSSDCPGHFIAKSVSVGSLARTIDARTMAKSVSPNTAPHDSSAYTPKADVTLASRAKEVVIGTKTIDIDLRQKVFTMPAPE